MFSNRHNSENYNSPDGKWMLKLGFPGFCSTKEELLREQDICRKVVSLGIPTPQVGEIVEQDGRLGLIYERIVGKHTERRFLKAKPGYLRIWIITNIKILLLRIIVYVRKLCINLMLTS